MTYPEVQDFVNRIKSFGFTVYLAERGTYGFITDDSNSRILAFSFTDGGNLGGAYGPPSKSSGTGWRMDKKPESLTSVEAINDALYATAPPWTSRNGPKGWERYSTVADYLALYGSSSRFTLA